MRRRSASYSIPSSSLALELTFPRTQGTEIARSIVQTFRLHDEEVQKLHAPIIAFGLLDLIEVCFSLLPSMFAPSTATDTSRLQDITSQPGPPHPSEPLTAALQLAIELLHEIPHRFFDPSSPSSTDPPPPKFGQTLADTLYGAADMKSASLPETDGRELLAGGLGAVLRIVQGCAGRLADADTVSEGSGVSSQRDLLLATASTLGALVQLSASSEAGVPPLIIPSWSPDAWTEALLRCLSASPASVANFELHSTVVRTILEVASQKEALQPALRAQRRELIEALSSKVRCPPCSLPPFPLTDLRLARSPSAYRLPPSRYGSLVPRSSPAHLGRRGPRTGEKIPRGDDGGATGFSDTGRTGEGFRGVWDAVEVYWYVAFPSFFVLYPRNGR